MWSNLGQKILVVLLIFSLILLTLMTIITHINLNKQFEKYLSEEELLENKRIAETMAQYYASNGNWENVTTSLYHMSMMSDARLQLSDSQGTLLVDTLPWLKKMYNECLITEDIHSFPEGDNVVKKQIKIHYGAVEVGLLTISRVPLYDKTDFDFRRTINTSIYITSLISLAAALIIGYFLTRRLVNPIQELTLALEEVESGNFSRRVEVSGDDEISLLSRHYNKMTEALKTQHQLRRKLSSDISHELRTPLTVLSSYLEAIKDNVMEPDEKTVDKLCSQTKRLNDLVNDLEELNRVESRTVKLEQESILLNEIIKQRIDEIHPLFKSAGITLVTHLPEKDIRAAADLPALDKVLTNLLNNACKYTNAGGTVTVRLKFTEEKAIIEIEDTGIGIGPEDLPYIFERFYRADPSRSRKTGGTGIGLAIVKELVEGMSGEIFVESRPGEGSVFSFTLPLSRDDNFPNFSVIG